MTPNDKKDTVVRLEVNRSLNTKFATNLWIQHSHDDYFVLSFFEHEIPYVTEEQQKEVERLLGPDISKVENEPDLDLVRLCTAVRVVVPPNLIPRMIKALQENWEKYRKLKKNAEK